MEPIAYLRAIRRQWPLVLLLMIVGATVGFLTAPDADDQNAVVYRAHEAMLVAQTDPGFSLFQLAYLTTVGEVPNRVATILGEPADDLANQVVVNADTTLSTLTIATVQPTAERAELVASTFASELRSYLTELATESFDDSRAAALIRLDSLRTQLNALDAQLGAIGPNSDQTLVAQRESVFDQYTAEYSNFQALTAQGQRVPVTETITAAVATPQTPGAGLGDLFPPSAGDNDAQTFTGPEPADALTTGPAIEIERWPRAVAGAGIGLLAGIALSLVLERFDSRIRDRRTAEEQFGLPVVAEVPVIKRSVRKRHRIVLDIAPRAWASESFRAMRTHLVMVSGRSLAPAANGDRGAAAPSAGPLVVMVTSAVPSEGKSTTTVNLAAAFAETGAEVLVHDCDFRRPSCHRFLRPTVERSVAGFLAAHPGAEPTLDDVLSPTMLEGVSLVRANASHLVNNPSELLTYHRRLLATTPSDFDVVIIDTAPILGANDAADLMESVDLVMVTARIGATRRDAARRANAELARLSAPVAGLVLVGAEAQKYGSYYSQEADVPRGRRGRHSEDAAPHRVRPAREVVSWRNPAQDAHGQSEQDDPAAVANGQHEPEHVHAASSAPPLDVAPRSTRPSAAPVRTPPRRGTGRTDSPRHAPPGDAALLPSVVKAAGLLRGALYRRTPRR